MYLKERRYDAYVTPEGGEEILLAKYYVPRNTGYPVNKVDVMWLWTSAIDTYELIDCSLFAYKKTETKNNYLYDKYNLMFGKYNVNNYLKIQDELKPLPKLLDGHDIMEILSIPQSKKLGEIINGLKEAQISGDVVTKNDAITFVKNFN